MPIINVEIIAEIEIQNTAKVKQTKTAGRK